MALIEDLMTAIEMTEDMMAYMTVFVEPKIVDKMNLDYFV
jgi:hypothetical protein